MSEEITEIEQLDQQEREELDQGESPPVDDVDGGEDSSKDTPPADANKIQRALKRAQAEAKKYRLKAAELEKAQKSGDMGDAETLREQIAEIRGELTNTKAEAALLRAGYTGDQPERMIRLLDLDDLDDSIAELKEEFPEKFGKKGAARSEYRPGGPQAPSKTPSKDATTRHSEELLGRHRGG